MILQQPLAVVAPTLDADVLTILAQAEASFTTGQIQSLAGRATVPGLRKVLERLVEQGIVHAERTPAAVLYSLNRRHLAADAIISLAGLRGQLLAALTDRFSTWTLPPVYAALFGSAARGDMNSASDLDLFITRPTGVDAEHQQWRSQVDELSSDVTAWTGNDARVLEFAADEIEALGLGAEPVLETIVAEGLTLRGPTSWLRKRLRNGTERT